MSIPDNPYTSPRSDVSTNHSTFSPEEWRYVARVFLFWSFGGGLLIAIVLTFQMHTMLSTFGGQEYLARVMTLAVLSQYGPRLVMGSACNTLVMVTEERAKRSILQPIRQLPWRLVLGLALVTPLAMIWILGLGLVIMTFVAGIPLQTSWTSIQTNAHGIDIAISMMAVVVGSMVLIASVAQMMKVLLRYRGWLIPKFIIATQAMALVLYLVESILSMILRH